MKKAACFICLLLTAVLMKSCSLVKYYDVYSSADTDSGRIYEKMEKIDLDAFDFYKREYYFTDIRDSLIKVYKYQGLDSENAVLYEMQFFLIERAQKDKRRVIYINMIPPYKYGCAWVYSHPLYKDSSVFNINQINYIQFGTLNSSNEVKFIKDKSVSVWNITLNDSDVAVDHVLFLESNKMVSEDPSAKLLNKPVYKKISEPKIFLSIDLNDKRTVALKKKNILYYNTEDNTINFEFKDAVYESDPLQKRWIRFPSSRVRGEFK